MQARRLGCFSSKRAHGTACRCVGARRCVWSVRPLHVSASRLAAEHADTHRTLPSSAVPQDAVQSAGPWRTFLSTEQLLHIDLLMYELGQYPEQRRARLQSERSRTLPTSSTATGATHAVPAARAALPAPQPSSRRKFAALDALRAATPRPWLPSPPAPADQRGNRRREDGAKGDGAVAAEEYKIEPFTSFAEVQQLVEEAMTEAEELDAHEPDPHTAAPGTHCPSQGEGGLVSHPSALFLDEALVLSRFGMGGSTSPSVCGFTGVFRQHWRDFHVTEMVSDATSPVGGVALSRELSYAVPPLPPSLARPPHDVAQERRADTAAASAPDEAAAEGSREVGGHEQHADEASQSDTRQEPPDSSLFYVDVRAHLSTLLSEPVTASDEAAAVRAEDAHNNGTGGVERGACAPTSTGKERERIDGSVHRSGGDARLSAEADGQAAIERRTRRLEELDKKEAALALAGLRQQQQQQPTGLSSPRGRRRRGGAAPSALRARFYLQCTLHKQHVAHSAALSAIAQTLRVHPRAISVAGIKDFIGDTVQRVRIENVSPSSARRANQIFRATGSRSRQQQQQQQHRPLHITLSDFSYETEPLSPGDLFGNHFRVVLRDVVAARAVVQDAMHAFAECGFPNYYGCQRFSWFAGVEDASFALLRHDWLSFAFRFLNFTQSDRSLRELLQRARKYPHPAQDEYRRNVVRRLRQIAVEPKDLDEAPFLSCPPRRGGPVTGVGGGPLNQRQELIVWQLREAFFDLHGQSRRLTAQRLSSYLWNQVLTLRLHHHGGSAVLNGDHVTPAALRRAAHSVWDRKASHDAFTTVVTPANSAQYTIEDVVHPGFSFEGIALPENPVGAYYHQVCERYHLDWSARHTRSGLHDFCEPARPIVRRPLELSYEYDESAHTLTVRFALERGCYANVAISELMKLARCAGSETVTLLPLQDSLWDRVGDADPGYVPALQDVYEGYEEGYGFTGDRADIELAPDSEKRVWDLDGPLFLPDSQDPFRKAFEWGSRNLLKNSERRASDRDVLRRQLFEAPLARTVTEDEMNRYAGHAIPLPPNARGKRIFFKVLRRNRRYAGAPRTDMRVKRGVQKPNRNHKLPAFRTLNKDAWNVSW